MEEIFHHQLKVDPIEAKPIPTACRQSLLPADSLYQRRGRSNHPALRPPLRDGPLASCFVDVTAKGNTKRNGIDQIIRHFGIKLEETMAFGDGGNDISMLRHAGIGVAMGNANNDVKAASNYTTTSVDEDGIANALKYFGIVGNPS